MENTKIETAKIPTDEFEKLLEEQKSNICLGLVLMKVASIKIVDFKNINMVYGESYVITTLLSDDTEVFAPSAVFKLLDSIDKDKLPALIRPNGKKNKTKQNKTKTKQKQKQKQKTKNKKKTKQNNKKKNRQYVLGLSPSKKKKWKKCKIWRRK